jgi:hypothetical protein
MSVVLETDTQELSSSQTHPPLPFDVVPENPASDPPLASPSMASTLYVAVAAAMTVIFFGLALWAFLVNTVGPPFSP